MVVYERHVADFRGELERLQEQRKSFASAAESLGVFSALDTPDCVGPAWSRRSG